MAARRTSAARAADERGTCALDRALGFGAPDLGARRALLRLLERRLGDATAVPATDAPRAVTAEAVTLRRDDDEVGLGEREVERGAPVLDEHGAAEQPRQHRLEPGKARTGQVDETARARRCGRHRWRTRRRRVEDEHQTLRVTGAQPFDRTSRGVAATHDDRAHRVAERGRHGRLGAGFDLEVVDERTDDAVDAVELGGRDVGARGLELLLERVGASTGAGRVTFRGAPLLLGRLQRELGRFDREQRVGARQREALGLRVERGDLLAQVRGVGDERLDDAAVGRGVELALHAAPLLVEQRGEAAAALAQRLDAHHPVGEPFDAERGERLLRADDRVVERSQPRPHLGLAALQLGALVVQSREAVLQAADLVTREVQADRAQLLHDRAVALRGLGLPLERRELAPDLAQQVAEAQQVALGGDQSPLGALLALAVLEDASGLLDDRASLLGRRVEDRVELSLADDDVLLAADARVGQQLLDVEEATGHAVDLVLRLTAAAEQRARDRDLGEVDRQHVRGVVDRERHLGAPERGAVGRAGEDDVLHLPAAQGARALRAEDPGDRVDEVRLAGAVGPDDDRDARLEVERGLLRERLEALERQRLQEQAGSRIRRVVDVDGLAVPSDRSDGSAGLRGRLPGGASPQVRRCLTSGRSGAA